MKIVPLQHRTFSGRGHFSWTMLLISDEQTQSHFHSPRRQIDSFGSGKTRQRARGRMNGRALMSSRVLWCRRIPKLRGGNNPIDWKCQWIIVKRQFSRVTVIHVIVFGSRETRYFGKWIQIYFIQCRRNKKHGHTWEPFVKLSLFPFF